LENGCVSDYFQKVASQLSVYIFSVTEWRSLKLELIWRKIYTGLRYFCFRSYVITLYNYSPSESHSELQAEPLTASLNTA